MCSIFNSASAKEIDCYVHLLDSNTKPFSLPGSHKGQELLTIVLNSLGVHEQQFFGLRFLDLRKEWQWMSAKKSVSSLVKSCHGTIPEVFGEKSCHLYLAVRFFPNDPCRELSEATRLQLFLQVIQDIHTRTVTVPRNHAARLAALMLQSFHGDFDHQKCFPLDQYDLFADLRPGIDAEVETAYRLFKGLHASQAEYQFLDHVKWFDGYGRVTFSVILENDIPYFLCIETTGVVLRDQKQSGAQTCFYWPRIKQFLLKKHKMVMRIRSKTEDGSHTFRTPNKHQLRTVWKTCSEHLEFFRSGRDPSFRQMSDSVETPAPTRRPSGRSRRRESEPHAAGGGRQRAPGSPASCTTGSPFQSAYNSESEQEYYSRPPDTRSVKEVRTHLGSSSTSVGDAYRPFMSDTEAVTKAGNNAGAPRRYGEARAAHPRSRSSASRARRPAGLEASTELLSHIRHDRVDTSGLSHEQKRSIEFTQLPTGRGDRGFRVTYDARSGRGRIRVAPPTEIVARSSGPADAYAQSLRTREADMYIGQVDAYAAGPPQAPAYHVQSPMYANANANANASQLAAFDAGRLAAAQHGASGHWHAHNSSYQAAVSDSEVTGGRRRHYE